MPDRDSILLSLIDKRINGLHKQLGERRSVSNHASISFRIMTHLIQTDAMQGYLICVSSAAPPKSIMSASLRDWAVLVQEGNAHKRRAIVLQSEPTAAIGHHSHCLVVNLHYLCGSMGSNLVICPTQVSSRRPDSLFLFLAALVIYPPCVDSIRHRLRWPTADLLLDLIAPQSGLSSGSTGQILMATLLGAQRWVSLIPSQKIASTFPRDRSTAPRIHNLRLQNML